MILKSSTNPMSHSWVLRDLLGSVYLSHGGILHYYIFLILNFQQEYNV